MACIGASSVGRSQRVHLWLGWFTSGRWQPLYTRSDRRTELSLLSRARQPPWWCHTACHAVLASSSMHRQSTDMVAALVRSPPPITHLRRPQLLQRLRSPYRNALVVYNSELVVSASSHSHRPRAHHPCHDRPEQHRGRRVNAADDEAMGLNELMGSANWAFTRRGPN